MGEDLAAITATFIGVAPRFPFTLTLAPAFRRSWVFAKSVAAAYMRAVESAEFFAFTLAP